MFKDWSKGNTNVSSPHLGIEPSFFMKSTCSTTSPEDQVNGRDYVPEGLFSIAKRPSITPGPSSRLKYLDKDIKIDVPVNCILYAYRPTYYGS